MPSSTSRLGLLDLARTPPPFAAVSTRSRLAVPAPPPFLPQDAPIAASHAGALAACWALVLHRWLGQETVDLDVVPGGATQARRLVLLPAGPAAAWTAGVTAMLQAPAEGPEAVSGEIHCLWRFDPGGPADAAAAALILALEKGELVADFDPSRLEPGFVREVLEAIARVAGAISREPRLDCDAVDVLGEAQRERLAAWNPPIAPADPELTVDRLVAQAMARAPAAIALDGDGRRFTYEALDRLADAIAHRLREAGVAANDVVGIAMERSPEAIALLLAVLRLGAAYLPLDARYPRERLAFMLDDAGARHVVADASLRPLLPATSHALDAAAMCAPAAHAMPPVRGLARGDTIAYVMYTSGSTGEPKGIAIPHRAIVRLVREPAFMRLGPETAMLHAAPLGFDASTLEIWGPLAHGGRCVLHAEAGPTGAGLARGIRTHGIDTAWLTAALFNAVVDDDPRHLEGLSQLLVGGEALSVAHVRRVLSALPGTQLINGYGPTECTTFTTCHPIPRDLPADAPSVPIGRPIDATHAFVLNARLQPLPAGFVGELCVGGHGLARGYVGRPALDTERFVASPFAAGERLYRTGDQVRFLEDGTIEFVGRRDGQVKVRGFRIELGEVETALARHASVKACAVTARDDGDGARLVAYVVPQRQAPSAGELREFLGKSLPAFMVPAAFVTLAALPITANGKLDRRALPAPARARPDIAQAYLEPLTPLEAHVCAAFAGSLGLDRAGRRDNFFELGGSSLGVFRCIGSLKREHGLEVAATAFFSDPTPALIAASLEPGRASLPARAARRGDMSREPLALIAFAGRFPGADTVEALWDNLDAGREGITFFEASQLDPAIPASLRDDPAYVRARGTLRGVEDFDAAFFGIPPREADVMDPQQRVFMELCWEALERAGYAPGSHAATVGVFGGMYNATYFRHHVSAHPDRIAAVGEFATMLANEKDYVATRTAHRLGLTGPAVSVHTACSTSLVAIVQAANALRAGQCDMALAGGASITCPPASGYLYQEGAMLSPDGHTRTFDAGARGTVFSDGAAVVLMKRLADAIADGDPIHAVIRGVAVNNDGGAKASFTAPSVDGQAAVVAAALDDAGVDARSIGYVEAHGTATPLGDPVEVEALKRAFRRDTAEQGFCRIGSVKSNLGHLVIAAGATGLIKAALSLERESIPATLHYAAPNPKLGLEDSPFVVNAAKSAWPRGDVPRRAGVSAFGVGGTNAHVIVEEAPRREASEPARGPQALLLSARSPAALEAATRNLAAHLERHPGINLADVAHTLRAGRRHFGERLAVAADSPAAAAAALRDKASGARARGTVAARAPSIAFLFPGQAAQYAGMGAALHEGEPAFREAFDECLEALEGVLDFDLRERLFHGGDEALRATQTTQPALFCIEYALARWWMAQGVAPVALAGHSVGEFVAATIAGVFRVEDAARLVARRGAIMQALPPGSMLAVRAGAAAIEPRLPASLSLAADNAPSLCVVAGPSEELEAFRAALEAEGIVGRFLQTSHAFHSAMMDAAVAPFEREVRRVRLAAPAIPIHSTVHGRLLTDAEAQDPAYWARHLREPVRFSPALASLAAAGPGLLLECGPRATLATLSRQHPGGDPAMPAAISSLADTGAAELASLRLAVGRLWVAGCDLRLDGSDPRGTKHRVHLPTYPFELKRHWLEAGAAEPAASRAPQAALPTDFPAAPESVAVLPEPSMSTAPAASRLPDLLARVRTVLEDVSGLELADADPAAPLVELGLDSLSLTQVAIQLKQQFKVPVTFRQLMEEHRTLDAIAAFLDAQLPASSPAAPAPIAAASVAMAPIPAMPIAAGAPGSLLQQVIAQQMQLMQQQIALLQAAGQGAAAVATAPSPMAAVQAPAAPAAASAASPAPAARPAEDDAAGPMKYDVKKAFGAIARIHTDASEITERQRARLDAFMRRYIARTRASKDYTTEHRPHLADPRVVNGFRPLLKEIVYQVVIGRSKGAHVWDLDGNQYVDVLNGFGMNMFGWSPAFVQEAVKRQLDLGYEIGPQHPLAGQVARKVCELTGHERAGLCNTGSEAVMGTVRIARTVTGRNLIAIFAGSYHGIFDEVIVRATRKQKAVPAAPGIMASTAQNVIVLDYGTPEAMQVIRERAHELAAVLVEPVQSRRPDFQPREFLQELRQVTRENGTLLILDEVVTGFRCHPGGIRQLFGVDADLCSYGKVVGGGFPIGVIAGKREFMDALDGGGWQYGDDSIPTVGVTYFAGTFVRHPLALAAADAVLDHLAAHGPALQESLTRTTAAMVDELNAFCRETGAPIVLKSFASVWKTFFTEDHPLQDLLFAMMRSRGVHVLDNFPCFFTTAHTPADIAVIKTAFKESVLELQEADFIPRRPPPAAFDASHPPVPGARIGKDADGRPAWFVPNPDQPGKYLRIEA
jgi:amino acid adenylation domain-containing protein